MEHPSSRSFALHLGLGDVPATAEEVLTEVGDRLADYQLEVGSGPDGELILRLTILAGDLWLAVLLAMNAATGVGYAPVWIAAHPARPSTGDRLTR